MPYIQHCMDYILKPYIDAHALELLQIEYPVPRPPIMTFEFVPVSNVNNPCPISAQCCCSNPTKRTK